MVHDTAVWIAEAVLNSPTRRGVQRARSSRAGGRRELPEDVLEFWRTRPEPGSDNDRVVVRKLISHADADVRSVAARLVALIPTQLPNGPHSELAQLARDPEPRVREAVVCTLCDLLRTLGGVARTCLVVEWATSIGSAMRMAIAHALQQPLPVVGARTALLYLSEDPDPGVRQATVRAMAERADSDPDRYVSVLERLSYDPQPEVQRAATQCLQNLRQETPRSNGRPAAKPVLAFSHTYAPRAVHRA